MCVCVHTVDRGAICTRGKVTTYQLRLQAEPLGPVFQKTPRHDETLPLFRPEARRPHQLVLGIVVPDEPVLVVRVDRFRTETAAAKHLERRGFNSSASRTRSDEPVRRPNSTTTGGQLKLKISDRHHVHELYNTHTKRTKERGPNWRALIQLQRYNTTLHTLVVLLDDVELWWRSR